MKDEIVQIDKIVLTDPEEMMLYAAMINQIDADHILDIGMYMKRIGAVSRSFQEFYIEEEKDITGLELTPLRIPIEERLYQRIVPKDFFGECEDSFGLVFALHVKELMGSLEYIKMWQWLSGHAGYVITDDVEAANLMGRRATEFPMTNATYYIIPNER